MTVSGAMRGSERRLPPLITFPVGGVGSGVGEAGTAVAFAGRVSDSDACETDARTACVVGAGAANELDWGGGEAQATIPTSRRIVPMIRLTSAKPDCLRTGWIGRCTM